MSIKGATNFRDHWERLHVSPYGQGRADASGVVIDMLDMDGVSLLDVDVTKDKQYSVAAVGGGATSGTLGISLHSQGLITPTGWSSWVGYTGWMCGGGYGFLGTKWGLGVDNLLGARLVTPAGNVIDTDDEASKDILWALRCAGNGNLGIVTEFRVNVYPSPKFLAGIIAFDLGDAKTVLQRFWEMVTATPGGLPEAIAGESMVLYPPGASPIFAFHFVWAALRKRRCGWRG